MTASLGALRSRYRDYLNVYRVSVDDPVSMEIRQQCLWPMGASFSTNLIPVTLVFAGGSVADTLYGAHPARDVLARIAHLLPPGSPDLTDTAPARVVAGRPGAAGQPAELQLTPEELEAVEREQETDRARGSF